MNVFEIEKKEEESREEGRKVIEERKVRGGVGVKGTAPLLLVSFIFSLDCGSLNFL